MNPNTNNTQPLALVTPRRAETTASVPTVSRDTQELPVVSLTHTETVFLDKLGIVSLIDDQILSKNRYPQLHDIANIDKGKAIYDKLLAMLSEHALSAFRVNPNVKIESFSKALIKRGVRFVDSEITQLNTPQVNTPQVSTPETMPSAVDNLEASFFSRTEESLADIVEPEKHQSVNSQRAKVFLRTVAALSLTGMFIAAGHNVINAMIKLNNSSLMASSPDAETETVRPIVQEITPEVIPEVIPEVARNEDPHYNFYSLFNNFNFPTEESTTQQTPENIINIGADVDISTINNAVIKPGALVQDASDLTQMRISHEQLVNQQLVVITDYDDLKMYSQDGKRIRGHNFDRGEKVTATQSEPKIFHFIHPLTGVLTPGLFIEVTNGSETGYSLAGYFATVQPETNDATDHVIPDQGTQTVPVDITEPDAPNTPINNQNFIETFFSDANNLTPTIIEKNGKTRERHYFEQAMPVLYTSNSGSKKRYNLLGTETVVGADGKAYEYAVLKHANSNLEVRVNKNNLTPERIVPFDENEVTELSDEDLIPAEIVENINENAHAVIA